MPQTLHWRLLVSGLCFISVVIPVSAKDFGKDATQLFEKRFAERKIDGTGDVFSIVVDCDSKRLKGISDNLQREQMHVVEYEFTFEINTQQKAKARVLSSGLDKAVEKCIIERYYKSIMFSPEAEEIMQDKIRFPVVLVKGKQPFVPGTPIGFVTKEQ